MQSHSPKLKLVVAAVATTVLGFPVSSSGVRVNPDGHGQALIYPYYTARSVVPGNAYVTALAVTNMTASAKAVKVRFLEGRAGAEVLDFNLFLSAYDVWTAGIVGAGAGAGIFTLDNSCTSPPISRNASNVTLFRNEAYTGDSVGDTLDRTYEGYIEMLEMGAIDPATAFGVAITQRQNYSAPNASRPLCNALPVTNTTPTGMTRPIGGLIGNASYINVNEGTDFSVDAIALGQWSDQVLWSASGNAHPTLADVSPAVSAVIDSRDAGDAMIVTRWNTGRDAVSALFMSDRIANDFTVEAGIKGATDWIVTMPTKRFYVSGTLAMPPFRQAPNAEGRGEQVSMTYFDREQQSPGGLTCFFAGICELGHFLKYASSTVPWLRDNGITQSGTVLSSQNLSNFATGQLNAAWINGWAYLQLDGDSLHSLIAPAGQSTSTNLLTGATTGNLTAIYRGLPVVGFSAQSYSTTGLPGVNPNVLSSYGGSFMHKVTRRIDIAP